MSINEDIDRTRYINTKQIEKLTTKLNKIENFSFKDEEGVKHSISQSNISTNTKRLLSILILCSGDSFIKDGKLNKEKLSSKGLNSLLKNFSFVFFQLTFYVIDRLDINEEELMFDKLETQSILFRNMLAKRIKLLTIESITKDIFSDLFNFIFEESENCGKFEEIINSCIKKELYEGVTIGDGYTLIEQLDNKTWKAKKYKKYYAIKFIPLREFFSEYSELDDDKFSKRMQKDTDISTSAKKQKLIERSIQYTKRIDYAAIRNITLDLLNVSFCSRNTSIYEVTRFIPNNLDNFKQKNKRKMISALIEFIKNIHEQGIIVGNLSMKKILVEENNNEYNFYLYDLSKMHHSLEPGCYCGTNYDSLSLVSKKGNKDKSNFYDDSESLLYIFNDIVSGTRLSFENRKDEKEQKKSLDKVLDITRIAIEKLRVLEQNDEIANGNIEEDLEVYGRNCYEKKKNGENILKIFTSFKKKVSKFTMENIEGTKIQKELYELCFNQISSNEDNEGFSSEKISLLALEKTFNLLYGCEYEQLEESDDEDS